MAAANPVLPLAAGHFHAEGSAVENDTSFSTPAPPLRVVNDLLVRRVQEGPHSPFFAYPATPRGKDDYVYHTVGDIDRYADAAACLYLQSGVVPQHPSAQKAEVVALLAPSNVDYVVSMFALSRLGFAVLLLSNRLATEAVVNLLQKTKCTKMIMSPHYVAAAAEAAAAASTAKGQGHRPVSVFRLIEYEQYSTASAAADTAAVAATANNRGFVEAAWPSFATTPAATLATRIAFVIHSSGSTGLPKPIFQTHAACLANYESGIPYRSFITLPLFHNHGLSTLFRALCAGKAAALYNANLPLAGSTLVASLRAVAPESLHCVPYALKLMGEDPRGIDALRALKLVLYGGSSCPDELGDRLVAAGVYLAGHYGATEMGQLMTSFRDPETDKEWAYMRPVPSAKPFLRMVPLGAGVEGIDTTYECVVLDGLPSKVLSNSDDPPGSFHTRDLFAKHPTMHNAWKHLGRIDDRVTLLNGEKVLPIPYEHQIRQHDLVRECVVFGVGRAVPGIMIVPSDKAASLAWENNNKLLLDALMPAIAAANAQTEAFGRISREMVAILPADTEYPCTDKGTVIRASFYQRFAAEIEAVYIRFEGAAGEDADVTASPKPLLTLSETELERYLLDLFTKTLGVPADRLQADTDLFDAGVDSLQAITARAQVLREVDLGGRKPGHNVVFELPSIRQLAQHFVALRTGSDGEHDSYNASEIKAMDELIAKYSDFSAYSRADSTATKARHGGLQTVLLTGATGSLGAHILHQLVQKDTQQVARVYCLVRAPSRAAAEERVQTTLAAKGLSPLTRDERVVCLPADLSQASVGLDDTVLADFRKNLTTVVHAAWAVNFNLGVRSFESHHIRGTRNLLDIALSNEGGGRPAARLFFCSSISAAAGTPVPATISEGYITNLHHAQAMGYARSKVVTEHIVRAAAEQTGMTARVLRLGQIIGDAERGIWNTSEAIPLIFQSALTTGTLPALDEAPSWMPVDAMARSVLELSGLTGRPEEDDAETVDTVDLSTVYQVQNRNVFRWTEDLLPALRTAGLEFKVVPQREWVARLRASDADPRRNPAIKLIDFYTAKYDNDRPGRAGHVFDTHKTEAASATMQSGFDVIGSGLVAKMVSWWKTQW